MSACSSSDDEPDPPELLFREAWATRVAELQERSIAETQSSSSPDFFRRVQAFFSLDDGSSRECCRDLTTSGSAGVSALYAMRDSVSAVVNRQIDEIQRYIEQTSWYQSYKEKPTYHQLPFAVVLLIMGTSYVTFSCVYLPAIGASLLGAKSVVFQTCFVMSSISYYNGIFTDPGHIPEEWKEVPTDPATGRIYLLIERKKTQPNSLRYCSKEQKYKPDRAHYSREMNRNCLRMDHHCPWLGNTVGHYNHKYFYLFILYSATAINMTSWSMIPALVGHTFNAGQTVIMVQGFFLSSIITSCLTPFFCFHSWLLSKNLTTIEYCEKRGSNENYESPYDVGILGNIRSVMGDAWYLWLVPVGSPPGDGISWQMRPGFAESLPADDEADQQQRDQTSNPDSTVASDSDLAQRESADSAAGEDNKGCFRYYFKAKSKEAEKIRKATVQAFCRCIADRENQNDHARGASASSASASSSAAAWLEGASSHVDPSEAEGTVSRLTRNAFGFLRRHEIPLGPVPGALSALRECGKDLGAHGQTIVEKCHASIQARMCPEPPAPPPIQTFRDSPSFKGSTARSSSSSSH